jgi:hypothetical protein
MGSHALSIATFWNFTAGPFAFSEGLNLGRPASNYPTDLPDGQVILAKIFRFAVR